MQKYQWMVGFIMQSILMSVTAFAQASPLHWNILLGLSQSALAVGDITLPFGERDTQAGKKYNANLSWGVGIDYHTPAKNHSHYQLTLYQLNRAQNGTVYQFGNPQFNNYFYHFKTKTYRLMLGYQYDFNSILNKMIPWLGIEAGLARVTTAYNEVPNYQEGINSGDIDLFKRTHYSFVYSLNVGLRYPLYRALSAGIRYQFTDFGHIRTSTVANNNIQLLEPITSRFYIHSVFLNLLFQV
ncbi:MAG: outer membrane beta-barrel protein [Legionellales bacterium]|nr:outer membrane beta-barrel protein [Legionellales bacterium]